MHFLLRQFRRLIRRAVRYGMQLGMPDGFTCEIAKVIINQYKNAYPELERNAAFVIDQLTLEEGRFARTLKQGNKEFDKVASRAADGKIDGETAFHLYDTYGFPIEMTVELAKERNLTVDTAARTAKRGDRTLELSAREYALLEYLIRSKGVVLSRQQIEDNLWSLDYAGGTNVVDVYISYLRKKLELPGERKLLHTVRGMGWVLKEDA